MKTIRSIFFIVFFFLTSITAFTQPTPSQNGNGTSVGNTPVNGPAGAPVDGGAGILLLLGAGYGLKKIRSVRKRE